MLLKIKLLLLVILVNGAPVVAKRVFGVRFAAPLDGGRIGYDGRPWLGPSKTARGVIVAVFAGAVGAPLLGLSWRLGAVIGALAMLGDLLSSFIKRRTGIVSSGRATGLDQIPESLFPLLACRWVYGLNGWDLLWMVMLFMVVEILLSQVLFRVHLRDRPY